MHNAEHHLNMPGGIPVELREDSPSAFSLLLQHVMLL